MDEHQPHQQPAATHEPSGVDMRTIGWSAIGLTALMLISLVLMWQLLVALAGGEPAAADAEADTAVPASRLVNLPELDVEQTVALEQMRRDERRTLEEYRWIDQASGVAQIPIERAIEIMAEDALPRSVPGDGRSRGGRTR